MSAGKEMGWKRDDTFTSQMKPSRSAFCSLPSANFERTLRSFNATNATSGAEPELERYKWNLRIHCGDRSFLRSGWTRGWWIGCGEVRERALVRTDRRHAVIVGYSKHSVDFVLFRIL